MREFFKHMKRGFEKSPLIWDIAILWVWIWLYVVTQDTMTAWLVSLYALAIAWKHRKILFP